MFENYEFRQLRLNNQRDYDTVKNFLLSNGLAIEKMDYYIGVFSNDELLAGGGAYKNVIKCIAITSSERESNLANSLLTHLHNHVREKGYPNTFLFTKIIYEKVFLSLAFYPVGRSPDAVLLESKFDGISSYEKELAQFRVNGKSGCIVVNCNPMTNGHLYLIETSAAKVDRLHIFVVSEEQPFMPAIDRYNLVKKNTAHLKNVQVHFGSQYIISQATFPSYFIKDASEVARNQILLDLDIFARHIAPALNITTRYLGDEPTDPATKQYNELMQVVLPEHGIKVEIIPRKIYGDTPISASYVRKLFEKGDFDSITPIVPPQTKEYLIEKYKKENECR
ncbi:MAG: [citrate (pro-3S)-lyase] ligase [Clostridia bacterium]|nr:[citrate (pro-3S)-lyase] ligase [Clostridia bacterium]